MQHDPSGNNTHSTVSKDNEPFALGATLSPHPNFTPELTAMAYTMHNPIFKRPTVNPPPRLRSISPPRAYVEPCSPTKPAPIEPNFNYPALSNPAQYGARPESAYATTPRARTYSTSHKNGHQRTPSTIDALAEAALAASPSYQTHSKKSSVNFEPSVYSHAHPPPYPYGSSEPPHKRSRSELLPSPQVGQHPGRPATSYEPNGWFHSAQPLQGYTSRVEEAALLLNFRSGGWPNHVSALPPPPAPAPRPHANSFPQDGFQARPTEIVEQSQLQPTLLPPFNPQDVHQPPPTLPSPPTVDAEPAADPVGVDSNVNDDVEMTDAPSHEPAAVGGANGQVQTPPDEVPSRAVSAEVTSSEVSDAPKGRRGWPKGKPRGAASKKTMAEKAASKRASTRKKTPESRTGKSKVQSVAGDSSETTHARRKSLSDAFVFGEHEYEIEVERPPRRAQSVPVEAHMFIREASPSKAVRRKPTARPDTICAGCETARETKNSHGEFDEWISCNGCKKWFHIDCAGFKKAHDVRDVDKYFCATCEPEHGKTTYVRKSTRAHASVDYAELQRGVLKTSEESVEHHYIQPIKDGTFQFDPETFPRVRPEMITKDFFEKSGTFVEPICIPAEWNPRPWAKSTGKAVNGAEQTAPSCGSDTMADLFPGDYEYDTVPHNGQDELDMVMPEGLTVRQVCNLVGGDTPIDVIDVKTQNSGAKWNLSRWADYYEETADEKAIRNVISLEVSQTKLGRLLQRPKLVRDIDLQDDVWPQEETDKGKFPKVQFYCLMSVADSYTDFHIDFGGSSVYYHILKGKKTFFFIPPKAKHLKAYEEWNDSPQQNYTFLPSITKECYRVDLSEGDTMLIPSGWIHAVWTPEDSLVIGGNFLNRMSYKNQFKVVEIEKANETPMKFRYPFFQKIMWYTAIKYLKTDPLPPAVSQLFYDGQRFERDIPIWADFEGEVAENDPRPGAHNARYYSQAEMEGLPDLVNFIFRTVMLVMGRVEGISADRMKRVNASIPKGYGEPLEVAKTFALWVAWKRGNEDPPAWAHPDAVLPNSKEEGPAKKLSERKLKELEKKEAIAAWRIAPDRQSARVMTKNANAAAAAGTNATSNSMNSSPAPAQPDFHQISTPYYQNQSYAPSQTSPVAPPDAFMMSAINGQYLSTPKTSVLGPKRVACDACRKRRIRCKHKDMVMQTTPNSADQLDGANASFQSQLAPELHENITVTPPSQSQHGSFMDTVMDGQQQIPYAQSNGGLPDEESFSSGAQYVNGQGPLPGTNAYVNANIPMTMNGVPIFGEVPKRGRSKACYECRKSKRRCIHDESGNVDPLKAAETPVPRGSVSTKKRQPGEDGSPVHVKRQKRQSDSSLPYTPMHPSYQPQMQGHGVLKPQPVSNGPSHQPRMSGSNGEQQKHSSPAMEQEQRQPPIDPNLFALYTESEQNGSYGESRYPYPTTEQPQPYPLPQTAYHIPSLEQIANEVLVDMSGPEPHDLDANAQQPDANHHIHVLHRPDTAPMPNGYVKQDESSVDSAVSLPTTEELEQNAASYVDLNAQPRSETTPNNEPQATAAMRHIPPSAHPSIETDAAQAKHAQTSPLTAVSTSPAARKSSVSNLPLYQPPAPPSQSPDVAKRLPVMTNGVGHGMSSSPVEATPLKRKRDSASATPGKKSAKKAKVDGIESHARREPSTQQEVDNESIELAKMLQQEDLGLRRRSK